jgi:hypothetical protein
MGSLALLNNKRNEYFQEKRVVLMYLPMVA